MKGVKIMTKEITFNGIFEDDNDKYELKVSQYNEPCNVLDESYYNMKLDLYKNGEYYKTLSLNSGYLLPKYTVVLNTKDYPWLRKFIIDNRLGDLIDWFYDDNNDKYPVIQAYVYNLEGFDEYVANHPSTAQRPTKIESFIWKEKNKHYLKNWDDRKHYHPVVMENKPLYRSSTKARLKAKQYAFEHNRLTAYLPKGMKAELEKYGEKASQILKEGVLILFEQYKEEQNTERKVKEYET